MMISSTPTATWEYKELQSCDIHHSTHLHPTGVCSLKASHHISHGNPGLMKPLLGSRRGPGWGLGLMAHGLVGTYGCRDEMFLCSATDVCLLQNLIHLSRSRNDSIMSPSMKPSQDSSFLSLETGLLILDAVVGLRIKTTSGRSARPHARFSPQT